MLDIASKDDLCSEFHDLTVSIRFLFNYLLTQDLSRGAPSEPQIA